MKNKSLLEMVRLWIEANILYPLRDPLKQLDELYQKLVVDASQKGTRTEESGKPLEGHSWHHFEEVITRAFSSAFTSLTTAPSALVRQLDAKIDALKQEITKSPYYEQCENLVQDLGRKKAELTAEIQRLKEKKGSIMAAFAVAKNIAKRHSGQTNGWRFFLKHMFAFYLVLVALGILDLPFSMASLENLNFGRLETLIVSCAIVGSVAALSHFGGLSLKRYYYSRSYRNWTFVTLALIFGFLFFATISRYQYAVQNEASTEQTTSFDFDTPENPADTSIIQRIQDFNLDSLSDPTFWLFLFMNFLIVATGVYFSFKVHDSDPDFEKAWCDVEFEVPKIEKEIASLTTKMNEAHALVEVQIQNYRSLLDPALQAQVKEYEESLSYRNVLADYINGVASQVEDKAIEVAHTYRSGVAANGTAMQPAEWSEPYHLEISRLSLLENNILKFFK